MLRSWVKLNNMEIELQKRLDEQGTKIDAIFESVEKTRKLFTMMLWITVAMVVLPALGLLFVIPVFINSYTSSLEGLI